MAPLGHNLKMTGAQCLADMLKGYGVTHVFMVPAVLRRTFAEMERRTDIKRIHCHGEKSAAYMADGYARASGKPGICMAQVIGALNLAAGLRDAQLAHAPVIAFTGGRDPSSKFRKVYQEVDDVPAFEPVTKFNATVDDVSRFPDMVRQAFRAATTGTPGPGASAVSRQRGPGRPGRGRDGAADRAAVRARAAVPPGAGRGERAWRRGGAAEGRAAGDRRGRRRARLGRRRASSSRWPRRCRSRSRPRSTARTTIPGVHPLSVGVVGTYSRESANSVVNRADLVCFIGTETGGMTTHFWAVPEDRHAARSRSTSIREALGRNYPLQSRWSTATPR